MRKLLFFASLALGCILCWLIGLRSPMLGYFFLGVTVTICATLIALGEPAKPPTQTTLPAPKRYRVIEDDVRVLPVPRRRLEVSR